MSDVTIPDRIPIPLGTAASAVFVGDLSARDISYAILVGHLASRTSGQSVAISDNGLRRSLARTRRENIEDEEARYIRLRNGRITLSDGSPVPLPTTMFRGSHPVRHTLDGKMSWQVEKGMLDAMRVESGTSAVHLPLQVLQHAKNRYTTTIAMRLLAWIARSPEGREFYRDERALVLRLPVPWLINNLGLKGVSVTDLMRHVLLPALEEITDARVGLVADTAQRRTKLRTIPGQTIRRRPPIQDIELRVDWDLDVVAPSEQKRVFRARGYQLPPRIRRDRPPVLAPTPSNNVIPFSATVRRPVKTMAETKPDESVDF